MNFEKKYIKKSIFGTFCPNISNENIPAPSLLSLYAPLTSCTISEKTNEPILRKMRY